MTANDVYENALILLDEVDETGTLSKSDLGYKGKAPYIIDMLQREIARAEGVEPNSISGDTDTALAIELVISDDSANRIMPYGLAAKLALADKMMEIFSYCQSIYDERYKQIGVKIEDFNDDMDIMRGF